MYIRRDVSHENVARPRVLFVEDEAPLRRAYQRFFDARYRIAFAATGAEAREQLVRFRPEIVVLDLRLPDTDGVDLLREIRAAYGPLPVIVTTAYASMQPLIDVLGLTHSGFLLKPFDLPTLAARIDAAG